MLFCICIDERANAEEVLHNNQAAWSYVDKWKQNLDALKLIRFSSSFVDGTEYEDRAKTEDNRLSVDWMIDFPNKRFWSGTLTRAAGSEKYSSEDKVIGEKALSVSKYVLAALK